MLIKLHELPVGATFYMPDYPGNVYRKEANNTATFLKNRNSDKYNGCTCILPNTIDVSTTPTAVEEDFSDLLS